MKKFILSILLFVFIFSSGYAVKISVSMNPYYLLLKDIVAEEDTVNLIIPVGKSPHTYSLSPNDLKNIYDSDVVFYNGLGAEVFIDKLLDNLKNKGIKTIEFGEKIPHYLLINSSKASHDHDEEDEHEHHHHGVNPHVWLDTLIIRDYVLPQIVETLSEINPDNEEIYEENARNFIEKFDKMDKEFIYKMKNTESSIMVFHNAYPYFTKRYNIKTGGVIQTSPGIDPSLSQMKDTIKQAKENNVKVIFIEPQLSDVAAKKIAAMLGIDIGILDPLGNTSYNSIMDLYEYNFDAIYKFLNK
jgi:zinc transport system substrate-binding protein